MIDLQRIEREIRTTNGHVCFSGGALGSDAFWGEFAAANDHRVIHWSFKGHKSICDADQIYRLDDDQLAAADEYLKRANLSIKRKLPFHKPWIINLLRRNWYQVRWTRSLYAISTFDDKGRVQGGTAWAVQMYLDRYIYDGEPADTCLCYVYDQNAQIWMIWVAGVWVAIDTPPPPQGIWTGVGTRDINAAGEQAIANLFQ